MPAELREALEAAISEVEKTPEAAPAPVPTQSAAAEESPPAAPAAAPEGETTGETLAASETSTPESAETAAPTPVETAPKSWKAPARAAWDKLPPEVRQEVARREREMTRAFGENSQARELHKNFTETVRPFEARLRAVGMNPVEAVGELLKADYVLSTAPTFQRAQFMAKLIKDYGVDIKALDAALAGEGPPDPVASRVEQMLAERLTPLQQFIAQQQQYAQQQERMVQEQASVTIEQMASDARFPHFEDLREDMADVIELNARRGVYLSPEQAYTRALAMNPELGAQVVAQQQAAAQRQQAQQLNSRAQRALNASSSVAGSPSGTPVPGGSSGSLREDIEAAFSQVQGR